MPTIDSQAGGWADFTGLTTGGTGGTLRTFDNFNALWDALEITDESEPEIFRYTGANLTLDPVRYQATSKQNKTIEATTGQILSRGELRFIEFNNLIVRNISRRGPYIDRVDSGTQQDYISLSGSTKVWIDHCLFDGEEVWEGPSIQFVDGSIDIGPNASGTVRSNYITISNCIFKGVARGILIGFSDTSIGDRTFNKVTIRNNIWENIQQRGPRVRFGEVEVRENYYRWTIPFPPSGVSNVRNIGVGREAQIYSQNNYYENGDRLFENYDNEIVKESGVISVNDFIGTYNASFDSPIRPENVLWNPNTLEGYYVGPLKTATEARDFVISNAGANLIIGETTYNLTLSSSNETFGTVSRSLSNPVTAGATVQLTATPVGTGVFQGWYLGSVSFANLITTDNPYSRVVDSDATIIASFIDGTPIPPEQPRKKWAKKRPVT